jgi:hypothetical protein
LDGGIGARARGHRVTGRFEGENGMNKKIAFNMGWYLPSPMTS